LTPAELRDNKRRFGPNLPLKSRSFYFAIGAVVYTALAALQQGGVGLGGLLALVVPPALLAWIWLFTHAARRVQGPVSPMALSCLRAGVWGAALWCAARSGPAGRAVLDVLANVGSGVLAVAASIALARLPQSAGLLKPPRSATALDAAYFNAALWGIATALPAARAFLPGDHPLLDQRTTDYATTAAAVGSLLVTTALALRSCLTRNLELGVADRSRGALALSAAAVCVSVPAALAEIASPERALPFGLLLAALGCLWAATISEPTHVSRGLRGMLAVLLLGAPLALTLSVLARKLPELSGPITLLATALGVGVGLCAQRLSRPFGPEQSRWLAALENASRAALEPDPTSAIAAALRALQDIEGPALTRPELWRDDPAEIMTVDAAGYLHTSPAAVPEGLYALAEAEPERTLRHDVVDALAVRRPEVRPLLAWMEERSCFAVTSIKEEQGPIGFLFFPAGSRQKALTLEEARAARRLADRLSAVLGVSSALARSRQRELAAEARAGELEQQVQQLAQVAERRDRQPAPVLERLRDNVRGSAYSAAARRVFVQLERLGRARADVALAVPLGVDTLAWVSALHLASPAANGPLAVVDAVDTGFENARSWQGRGSAFERAAGGTLLVLNANALSPIAQDTLAVALAQRNAGAEAPPPAVVIALREPLVLELERRRISRALAQFFTANVLELPALHERPEDLRALVLRTLAESGAHAGGDPLGVDPEALRLLVEYEWPGNELELRHVVGVVGRAARLASAPRVALADLAAAGFGPAMDEPDASAVSSAPDADSAGRTSSAPRRRRRR
jgi:hypothetical protein